MFNGGVEGLGVIIVFSNLNSNFVRLFQEHLVHFLKMLHLRRQAFQLSRTSKALMESSSN